MERSNPIDNYIILGATTLIILAVLFTFFILLYKRRMIAKQTIIDMLQNECKEEIEKLKKEVEALKRKNSGS